VKGDTAAQMAQVPQTISNNSKYCSKFIDTEDLLCSKSPKIVKHTSFC
jgi:hypothetical protein